MIPFAKKGPSFRLALCAVLVGLTVNGCFETGVAGTSTTTGNTISARAMLSDGNPAAGATVSLRLSGFVPPGVPGFRRGSFSKDTTADANGYFEMRVPAELRYFLSVYAGGASREGYWRDGLTSSSVLAKTSGANDTVHLQKTGGLSGTVVVGAADSIWLGFPGTSHFTRLQANGSFTLDSLPPGSHGLRIFRSNSGAVQSVDVGGWTLLSEAAMILDTLALPADTTIHVLSVSACLDHVDSIAFALKAAGPSDPRRRFRTLMLSPSPEWVELDACLGQWTRKGILSTAVPGNFELFAGASADYLIRPDSGQILKLNAAGIQILPVFPANLALANFRAGRFYSFHHLDTALRSFPDEAAWLGNLYDRSFPRPAGFQRFAVGDSAIQYLVVDGAGYALSRFEFNSGTLHSQIRLPGLSGNCVGMAAGSNEDIWLLDGAGALMRVDGLTGRTLTTTRIVAPDSLRGLAGP